MKIIKYRSYNDIDIQFIDKHNHIIEHCTYTNFKRGNIHNPFDKTVYGVGFLGVGEYKTTATESKFDRRDYKCWGTMIARCYCISKKNDYPAYVGITTMCEEWLNFQNFAKWYEENHYDVPSNERMHIDKDILFSGNKVYSPDTCIFVPQRINMLFTNKSNKKGLPNGLSKNIKGYSVRYNGLLIGEYETLEEAFEKYAIAKKEAILNIAEEYKQYIPKKLYEALIKYEVRIDNDKNFNVVKCQPIDPSFH